MSTELMENVDQDEDGNIVGLTMNAHCHAWLSVFSEVDSDYHLTPDEDGIARARDIINGLEAWIDQVKSGYSHLDEEK